MKPSRHKIDIAPMVQKILRLRGEGGDKPPPLCFLGGNRYHGRGLQRHDHRLGRVGTLWGHDRPAMTVFVAQRQKAHPDDEEGAALHVNGA